MMKFNKVGLVLLAAAFATVAFGKDQLPTTKFAVKISKPAGEHAVIYSNDYFGNRDTLGLIDLKDGEGSTDLTVTKAGFYDFFHGKERTAIWLIPGGDLSLSLNTKEFDETLKYEGSQSLVNNYLAESYLKAEQFSLDYKAGKDEFTKVNDAMRNALAEHLESFVEGNKDNKALTTDFHNIRNAEILYNWAVAKLNYPRYHTYYTKEEVVAGDAYYTFMDNLDINNSNLLGSANYRRYLGAFIAHKAITAVGRDASPEKMMLGKVKAMRNNIRVDPVRNFLLTEILYNQLRNNGVNGVDGMIDKYQEICTNDEFKKMVNAEYAKWEHLAAGKPAPIFKYKDINGKDVSLADLKGSYVYIDVWATWCGPCKHEQPYLHEIEEACKDYNIKFVAISVDKDKAAWEKMVAEKKLEGIQLHTGSGWKSGITKDYNIGGIPRFILIDREGNIINANAPRPSGNIKEIIEKLEGIKAS